MGRPTGWMFTGCGGERRADRHAGHGRRVLPGARRREWSLGRAYQGAGRRETRQDVLVAFEGPAEEALKRRLRGQRRARRRRGRIGHEENGEAWEAARRFGGTIRFRLLWTWQSCGAINASKIVGLEGRRYVRRRRTSPSATMCRLCNSASGGDNRLEVLDTGTGRRSRRSAVRPGRRYAGEPRKPSCATSSRSHGRGTGKAAGRARAALDGRSETNPGPRGDEAPGGFPPRRRTAAHGRG